jgi:hypothetical protein
MIASFAAVPGITAFGKLRRSSSRHKAFAGLGKSITTNAGINQ